VRSLFWTLVIVGFIFWGLWENSPAFHYEANRFGSTVMRKLHAWENSK